MGDRVALAFSVHTGWAACVVVAGTLRAPQLVLREQIALRGDPERFLFHRAVGLSPADAARATAAATAEIVARAEAAVARLVETVRAGGDLVAACVVVAGTAPMPAPLAAVLAARPRIHLAEGCVYRDALRAASEATGLPVRVLSPRALDGEAARAMRVSLADLPALLAAAGRPAGRPWARDQKACALAAWVALADA